MELRTSSCGKKYFTENRPEIDCFKVYGSDYKRFLMDFIPYLESKPESEWIDSIFTNTDTSKRCVIYHFLGFVGQDNPHSNCGNNLDWYESCICPIQKAGCFVNDGNDPDYQQASPKQRSIAFLENLLEGKELTTMQALDKWLAETEVAQ